MFEKNRARHSTCPDRLHNEYGLNPSGSGGVITLVLHMKTIGQYFSPQRPQQRKRYCNSTSLYYTSKIWWLQEVVLDSAQHNTLQYSTVQYVLLKTQYSAVFLQYFRFAFIMSCILDRRLSTSQHAESLFRFGLCKIMSM